MLETFANNCPAGRFAVKVGGVDGPCPIRPELLIEPLTLTTAADAWTCAPLKVKLPSTMIACWRRLEPPLVLKFPKLYMNEPSLKPEASRKVSTDSAVTSTGTTLVDGTQFVTVW